MNESSLPLTHLRRARGLPVSYSSPSTHILDGTYSDWCKKWWSSLKNVANPHFSLCRRPPSPPDRRASGRTRPLDPQCGSVTVSTPYQPNTGQPDHTVSVASRSPVEGAPDQRPHFPAQPRARCMEPRTDSDPEHVRPGLRTAVGRCDLHWARLPERTGAVAGSALARPSWAATVAAWPQLSTVASSVQMTPP